MFHCHFSFLAAQYTLRHMFRLIQQVVELCRRHLRLVSLRKLLLAVFVAYLLVIRLDPGEWHSFSASTSYKMYLSNTHRPMHPNFASQTRSLPHREVQEQLKHRSTFACKFPSRPLHPKWDLILLVFHCHWNSLLVNTGITFTRRVVVVQHCSSDVSPPLEVN